MVNRETVNDPAKLIGHRLIARQLPNDAGMVTRALARLDAVERQYGRIDWVDEWRELRAGAAIEIRRRITARDEGGVRLRLSSPFATVSGLALADLKWLFGFPRGNAS